MKITFLRRRDDERTEIVVHAEVSHELREDFERIVKMKLSVEKIFGETFVTAGASGMETRVAEARIVRQTGAAQLIVTATFVL